MVHYLDVLTFLFRLYGRPLFSGSKTNKILAANKSFSKFSPPVFLVDEKKYDVSKESKHFSYKISFNAIGLSLLSQLLENDPNKRCTAEEAINHAYFAPIFGTLSKLTSSKELIAESPSKFSSASTASRFVETQLFKSLEYESSLMSPDSPNTPYTFELPEHNRFVERGSLYLDLGKPEFNGEVETYFEMSLNNSIIFESSAGSSNNTSISIENSISPTGKRSDRKSRSRSRSQSASQGKGFLITAILNTIKKNTEGEKDPKEEEAFTFPEKHLRLHIGDPGQLNLFGRRMSNSNSQQMSSNEELDDMDDDIGEENCQMQTKLDQLKADTRLKHPSKVTVFTRGRQMV